MRKYNFIFMAVLLLACAIAPVNQTRADDISKQKASQVGAYFLASQFGDKAITAESLIQVYEIRNAVRDIPALYVFNTADKRGCVIVAGSDCMSPIIGYSTEGGFDPTDIPENLLVWLGGYVNFITYAQNTQMAPSSRAAAAWDELLEERLPYFGNNTKAIVTLLSTKWDQDSPYNLLCPLENGHRCYAGCVATAMGQILKYWSYPVKGQGRKSYRLSTVVPQWQGVNFDTVPAYDYDLMPSSLTTGSPTAAQILEVARLLRDVGLILTVSSS